LKASRAAWTRLLIWLDLGDHGTPQINQSAAPADEGTMSRVARAPLLLVFAGLAAIYVTYVGFAPQTLGDYGSEAAPAMNALLIGHVHSFFTLEPAYGGSLLLRAPAALLANALGGDQLAIFRAGAFPCVLACGLLGVWLALRMRAGRRPVVAWLTVLVLCALAPLVTEAVAWGHPEEALGAALCVSSVLLAANSRAGFAGLALGLAIITKQWGVLALAPALLAIPARPGAGRARAKLIALALGLPATLLLVTHLVATAGQSAVIGGAQQASFAHAFDLWWPFAHASRHLAVGSPPFWITNWSPPALIASHAHELIVALSVPLAALVVLRRGWGPGLETCLALLALMFLLRCMLDPQDLFYYHLPLIIALTAWESYVRRGAPWLSISCLVLLDLVFTRIGAGGAHSWADFAAYLTVTLPLAGYLVIQLVGGPVPRRARLTSLSPAAARH
jgi:hypothetical protein